MVSQSKQIQSIQVQSSAGNSRDLEGKREKQINRKHFFSFQSTQIPPSQGFQLKFRICYHFRHFAIDKPYKRETENISY